MVRSSGISRNLGLGNTAGQSGSSGRAPGAGSRKWVFFSPLLLFHALFTGVWGHWKILAAQQQATASSSDATAPVPAVLRRGRAGANATATSFRPARLVPNSATPPDWAKEYAAWHATQRSRYLDAHRLDGNASSVDDVRFLIVRCLNRDVCGGVADRLQDIPYDVLLANRTGRVLLVRWERPAPLENFLVPPADGGIDWTLSGEMHDAIMEQGGRWHLMKDDVAEDRRKVIVSKIRSPYDREKFHDYEDSELGRKKIYHEIFRLLFSPSKALAERVDATMSALNLVPSRYSSAHVRVRYPFSKGMNEREYSFQTLKQGVTKWAENAVDCAARLHPRSTIYVSSDDNNTIGYLMEESNFSTVRLAAREYSTGNEHLEFSGSREANDFMGVFVDLLIMGMGRCVAYGRGGFGRLGAALSGRACVAVHRGTADGTNCHVLTYQ